MALAGLRCGYLATLLAFYAILRGIDPIAGVSTQMSWSQVPRESPYAMDQMFVYQTRTEQVVAPSLPGVGTFLFDGDSRRLPQGFGMIWQTCRLSQLK